MVAVLTHVQNDLFDVGADFCTPVVADPEFPPLRIEQDYVDRLEGWCDHYNESLPKLRSFILNGGTPGAAHLHVARTVVRRAERSAWAAHAEHGETMNVLAIKYLNRLSDLLFILARHANREQGDVLWVPGGERSARSPGSWRPVVSREPPQRRPPSKPRTDALGAAERRRAAVGLAAGLAPKSPARSPTGCRAAVRPRPAAPARARAGPRPGRAA